MAYRAFIARLFSRLSLGLVIVLISGCSQDRQLMRNLDINAPKPGYVQVPPCDRPQLLAGTLLPGERSQPGEAHRSRRERIQQRANCQGCGEIFWNSWHSDPPRPQDRIASHYPLEMVRGANLSCAVPQAPGE